jgi:hypothetical protein
MPQIDANGPHLIAEVRLLKTGEGGRSSPLLPPHFTCPMEIAGELLTCRLYLESVGRADPGSIITVPVRFLAPELVRGKLNPGLHSRLWDGKFFADGTVLRVSSMD